MLARSEGFEPPTPKFEVWCSIQLSYERGTSPEKGRSIQSGRRFGRAAAQLERNLGALPGAFRPCYEGRATTKLGTKMAQREPSPFTRLMGIKIISWTAERTESELVIREDLCNRRGVMHGGAVMAWGDTLGGMTASAALTETQSTATIESKTNFFAPIPKGDTARAVCVPLHSGRTTIVLQTNITRSDGKLAAIVTQTQIVLPKPG